MDPTRPIGSLHRPGIDDNGLVASILTEIPVDRTKPGSLAQQIRLHLERLIQSRVLAPGVKLPATRELARTLGVNRATVALAYEELVTAGWAWAHVGQGTFVGRREGPLPRETSRVAGEPQGMVDWGGLLSRSAQVIAADVQRRHAVPVPVPHQAGLISFAGGMPDSDLFPTEDFRRVLNHVIRREGPALLQYYPVGGYPPLRRFLADYLLRFGLEIRPEELLIVNGSQQGFDLIARTLIDPGDVVAIEQPTYPRAVQVFRSFGAQLLPVPMDSDGPRLDALERALERHAPKFLFCQPSAHNPTGLTMSAEARRRLLDVAARRQVVIVEDGFDPGLCYSPVPPSPLKALDHQGLVIYIGTFSKILFPGLRLGWVVAPAPVLERLEAAKQLADIQTSALIQAAVFHFCERRLLDRHVERIGIEYERRQRRLLESLGRRMPRGVTWTETQGGFSSLVTLPDTMSAPALLRRAIARGVAFTPGPAFYIDQSGEHRLRLSFSSVPVARIDEGVRRLADAIREARRRTAPLPEAARAAVPLV
jgi:GntR family transcriptional regulator/MocR family aminotransferase